MIDDVPSTALKDHDVLSKTRAVIAYDRDESREGRPLSMLFGGAFVALVALVLIFVVAYRTWWLHEIGTDSAYFAIGLLFAIHTFGVFLFAYAYELYDVAKALRLTIIIALVSVAAIFAVIVALAVLAKAKGGGEVLESLIGDGEKARPLFGAIGSMIEDGAAGAGEASTITARRERPEDTPRPYQIHCPSCGELFSPAPPKATCPWCGQAALAGA